MSKLMPDYYERTSIKLWPNGDFDPQGLFGEVQAKSLELKQVVSNMVIFESLLDHSIRATIDVLDANNILEDLRIEGDEYITIEFKKDTPEGKSKYKIRLMVTDIKNYVRPSVGAQTYRLECSSEHDYLNQLTILDRKFEGNIGKLVSDIVKKDLRVSKDHIGTINTKTAKLIKGIYPQLRPVNAVKWLTRNAFENSTPFFFYESIESEELNKKPAFNKINFTSLDALSKNPVVAKFERKPYNTGQMLDEKDDIRREQILSVSVPQVRSTFEDLQNGAYGSTITHLDISTKTLVTNAEHKHDGKFVILENKFKPMGDAHNKFLDKKITDFPYAKRFYSSQNSLSFDGFDNYHAPVVENIRKAAQKISGMEISKLVIDIYGDPRLTVGSKIDVKIGKALHPDELETNKVVDESVSGVYIIYDIIHTLTADQKWTSQLNLRKDSSNLDYNSKITKIKDKSV